MEQQSRKFKILNEERGGGVLTAIALLEMVRRDGVQVGLSSSGRLKASGPRAALDKWLPELKARRPDIEAALAPVSDDAPVESLPAGDLPPNLRELISRPCPDGFAPQRWAALCEGVERLAQQWAEKAISLGWTFEELFARRDPFANVSLQGAAWCVGDKTVTAVTADAITLRSASGSTTRIYRKSEPGDGELRAAVEFLEVELAAGAWHNSFNIEAKADAVGITIENLARARHKLGVKSRQWPGTPRRWRLPDGEASR